jgi:hypothetical protein
MSGAAILLHNQGGSIQKEKNHDQVRNNLSAVMARRVGGPRHGGIGCVR